MAANDTILPRRWWLLSGLFIATAALLPYLHILDSPFVFDDVKLVQQNEFLRAAADDMSKVWPTFNIWSREWDDEELRANYRPLRFLSYVFDYKLSRWWFGELRNGEPPPYFFHLTNVLWHALNAVLLFGVIAALLRGVFPVGETSGVWDRLIHFGALSGALIFALHPIQTEAVTYISGRRDVLFTFFFFLALWLSIRGSREAGPGLLTIIGAPLCFAAGLLAKEMAITLPAVVLLVDLLRGVRWTRARAILHYALWTVAAVFIRITLANKKLIASGETFAEESVLWVAPRLAIHYLGLALFPHRQSIDYSYDAIPVSAGPLDPWTGVASAVLVLLAGIAGAWLLWRTWRAGPPRVRPASAAPPLAAIAALGVLWFGGTLVPVLQIVPIAERFAERFVYMPAVGVFVLGAGLLVWLYRREAWGARGVLAVLCLVLFAASWRRNSDWQSPLKLWTAAVETQPRCARARLALADALAATGRPGDVVDQCTEALAIFRERPESKWHRGYILRALLMRGKAASQLTSDENEALEQAVADYREVLASADPDTGTPVADAPEAVAYRHDLALFLFMQRKFAAARQEMAMVLANGKPPQLMTSARYYLAKIDLLEGKQKKGLEALRVVYDGMAPNDPQKFRVAAELVRYLMDQHDFDGALDLIDSALAAGARGDTRSSLLVRKADLIDRAGHLNEAIRLLKVCLDENPDFAPALNSLGKIELNRGEVEKARAYFSKVLNTQLPSSPAHREACDGLSQLEMQARLGREKNPDEERQNLLEAIEKKAAEHIEKGQWLAAMQVYGKLYERAMTWKEKDWQWKALRGRARVEVRLNKHGAALRSVQQALALKPNDRETLRQAGDICILALPPEEKRGREPKSAVEEWERRALDYYTRYIGSLEAGMTGEAYVHFFLGQLLKRTDPARALELMLRSQELGYKSSALDHSLGYVYASLELWEKSLDAFNRYLEQAPAEDEAQKSATRAFVKESVLPHLVGE